MSRKKQQLSNHLHALQVEWTLTKVITIVVPTLILSSPFMVIKTFLSIFIIFLSEIFILQNFIGLIYFEKPFMGLRIILKCKRFSIFIAYR